MRAKPYPRYKRSGVEWLCDVPEHWEVKKIKYSAQVESGHTPSRSHEEYWVECDIPWVSLNDSQALRERDYITETRYQISELGLLNSSARLLPACAVVFSRDATVGLCAITTRPMAVSQHFIAYLCEQSLLPEYLLLCLKAMTQHLVSISLGTTIPTIGMDDIYSLRCPLPPLPEQTAIAALLDRETGRLDRLVAKKRDLIERLKEKRTALISRTVTRGLPPAAVGLLEDPPLKHSGLDWLGDIPKHWEVCKLKRVTISRCDGPFGSGLKSEHYSDDGVRVIRLQNIRFATFDDRDSAFVEPEYYAELGDHGVLPDDLLIAGLGDENHPVGRACVAPPSLGPAMVKADCFRFRLNSKRANAAYVALQLSTTADALAGALATGTTRGRMNLSATEDREIAVPPLPEQSAIVAYLDAETAKLDALVGKVEEAVERLQEYRTALITAAVTGKIDVRTAKQ